MTSLEDATAFMEDVMTELSSELGLYHYRRNEIECCSCESYPRRYLDKQDMFCEGCSIFDLDPDGRVVFKKFGRYNRWIYQDIMEKQMIFLKG